MEIMYTTENPIQNQYQGIRMTESEIMNYKNNLLSLFLSTPYSIRKNWDFVALQHIVWHELATILLYENPIHHI